MKKCEEICPLNIHSFLWLMGLHLKFKFLCMLGFHNYMLHQKHIKKQPRIENDKLYMYFDVEPILIRKCYCCGKEESI